MRTIILPLFILLFVVKGDAEANRVGKLIKQLTTSSSSKVRLSAALSLSKIRDKRAINAFVKALKDPNKTTRGVAAAALGKLVDSTTPTSTRTRVLAALDDRRKRDKNPFVKRQAERAYKALKTLQSGAGGKPKVYIDVGGMSVTPKGHKALRSLMVGAVKRAFRGTGAMETGWPGGGRPSRRQLGSTKAFHINGTLTKLDVSKAGRDMKVACRVSMYIASYPKKSAFAFANGGGAVIVPNTSRDIKLAKQDCARDVVRSLVSSRIIPAIQQKIP